MEANKSTSSAKSRDVILRLQSQTHSWPWPCLKILSAKSPVGLSGIHKDDMQLNENAAVKALTRASLAQEPPNPPKSTSQSEGRQIAVKTGHRMKHLLHHPRVKFCSRAEKCDYLL